MGDPLGSAGVRYARSCTPAHSCHLIRVQADGVSFPNTYRSCTSCSNLPPIRPTTPKSNAVNSRPPPSEPWIITFRLLLSSSLFAVSPSQSTEALLANASETFASLNALTSNLAFELEGSQRGVVLAIQQMSELGQLLVDQALEQVAPSSAA